MSMKRFDLKLNNELADFYYLAFINLGFNWLMRLKIYFVVWYSKALAHIFV